MLPVSISLSDNTTLSLSLSPPPPENTILSLSLSLSVSAASLSLVAQAAMRAGTKGKDGSVHTWPRGHDRSMTPFEDPLLCACMSTLTDLSHPSDATEAGEQKVSRILKYTSK